MRFILAGLIALIWGVVTVITLITPKKNIILIEMDNRGYYSVVYTQGKDTLALDHLDLIEFNKEFTK